MLFPASLANLAAEVTFVISSMEGTFWTALTDTREQRDVMLMDAPNMFAQAKLNRKKGQLQVIMKITGVLVEPLTKKAPQGFAALEHGKKVVCLNILKAVYALTF